MAMHRNAFVAGDSVSLKNQLERIEHGISTLTGTSRFDRDGRTEHHAYPDPSVPAVPLMDAIEELVRGGIADKLRRLFTDGTNDECTALGFDGKADVIALHLQVLRVITWKPPEPIN